MGYWRGLVGRGLSGSLPSFRRAAQRRSAPRLDEGSVPGMDFGAESTAMVQGGEYCGNLVACRWGLAWGRLRVLSRSMQTSGKPRGVNVGRIVSGCCYSGYDHCTATKFTITSLFMHGKCAEKLWQFIHTREHHMVSCQIQKMRTAIQFKAFFFPPRVSSKNVNIKMYESVTCYRSV